MSLLRFTGEKPDYNAFQRDFLNVAENAAISRDGLIGYLLGPALYAEMYPQNNDAKDGHEPFELLLKPANPPANASESQLKRFEFKTDEYNTQVKDIKRFRKEFIQSLDNSTAEALSESLFGLTRVALPTIYAKLKEVYGTVTERDLNNMLRELEVNTFEDTGSIIAFEAFLASLRQFLMALIR